MTIYDYQIIDRKYTSENNCILPIDQNAPQYNGQALQSILSFAAEHYKWTVISITSQQHLLQIPLVIEALETLDEAEITDDIINKIIKETEDTSYQATIKKWEFGWSIITLR